MIYSVELTDRAEDDLSRLDQTVAQRVERRLRRLTGRHAGKFRLRIGDYRALYWLDRVNRRVVVESIGHRSDVY